MLMGSAVFALTAASTSIACLPLDAAQTECCSQGSRGMSSVSDLRASMPAASTLNSHSPEGSPGVLVQRRRCHFAAHPDEHILRGPPSARIQREPSVRHSPEPDASASEHGCHRCNVAKLHVLSTLGGCVESSNHLAPASVAWRPPT